MGGEMPKNPSRDMPEEALPAPSPEIFRSTLRDRSPLIFWADALIEMLDNKTINFFSNNDKVKK